MLLSKKLLISGLSLLTLSTASASYLTPSTNLSVLAQQIITYHESGAYVYDIAKVADQAQTYLEQRIQQNKALKDPKKLAVVLDIDETSLSNYRDLKALDFGGTAKMQNAAENRSDDSAIQPTLQLYRYAIGHGVTVFFITGRTEQSREATLKNLVNVGYTSVKSSTQNCENSPVSKQCLLYLRDGKFLNTSAIPYKTAMRKKLEQAGYDVVINVGDQYSDLAGGYSERTYKYPDYMYYIG